MMSSQEQSEATSTAWEQGSRHRSVVQDFIDRQRSKMFEHQLQTSDPEVPSHPLPFCGSF